MTTAYDDTRHVQATLGERDRLEGLLRDAGAGIEGCGFAFDGTSGTGDITYTAGGRRYSLEVRDITDDDGGEPWDGS
jgi:hypothetical protein